MARNILIVGGVALGSKAGCRIKRIEPDANVVLIDQDEYISYGGCGIPFYVSGDVSDESELRSTSFHMLRDEAFFQNVKGIKALTSTSVLKINRDAKTILIRKKDGTEEELPYDKLILGTGSVPRDLKIPGQDLENIYTVASMHDAMGIKDKIVKGAVGKAVIVGGGFIGLEMAEALTDMWGIETTLIEIADQVMQGFASSQMEKMARRHMEDNDVAFCLGERVVAFEGEDGAVKTVKTDKRELEADLVIMAVGVVPNSALAKDAGLDVGVTGGIVVNERLETSDPDIYAGGDCIEISNSITGKPGYYPLGSMANRQGRVIGTNATGGNATFDGAVGSCVVKIFENSLAGAGLTIDTALKEGFDAVSVQMCQLDRAHFYPEKELMYLELVVERGTKRVLGIQGLGSSGDAMVGRINAVAAILKYKPVVQDISNLELAYSPPFSSAMDIVNALANVADNLLDDYYRPIGSEAFEKYWEKVKSGDVHLIDCRALPDAKPFMEKHPDEWHSIPQDELRRRINEVPRDKKLVLVCNTGVRSYEAQLNLRELGFNDNVSVQGGMAMLQKWGMDL